MSARRSAAPSISRRLCRLLVSCYPQPLRSRYGDEMEAALLESLRLRRREHGLLGLMQGWAAGVVDLLRSRRVHGRAAASSAAPSRRQSPTGPVRPTGDPGTPGSPGDVAGLGRAGRDSRLDSWLYDLRFALRSLRRTPGFTAVAVATLALGVGASTAIFSVVDAVVLEPLPFPDAERLMAVHTTLRDNTWWFASPREMRVWREANESFEQIGFSRATNMSMVAGEEPEALVATQVTPELFGILGVEPLLGRGLRAADGRPGAEPVLLLSEALWRQRFGAEPDLVGRTLQIDGAGRTVVGVVPAGAALAFPAAHDIYVPFTFDEQDWQDAAKSYRPIGRLRDGITPRQAEADMRRVAAVAEEEADLAEGWSISLVPLGEEIVGGARGVLLVLLGSVGFVLLVACANISNLLLARGASRHREMAVRTALGAGRGRLGRQLLTETAVLSLAGGLVGLVIAAWATRVLLQLAPGSLPRESQVGIDPTVLGFAVLVTLASGLLFGLLPALRASRVPAQEALRDSGDRSTGGRGILRLRGLLVAGELAVVLVLLIGATLMLRSFANLLAVDPGFRTEQRVAVRIDLPPERYADPDRATAFFRDLVDRVQGLAETTRAGTISRLPFASDAGFTAFHIVEGRPLPEPGQEPVGGVEGVTPGYFETMGIPLLRGRLFEPGEDRADGRRLAVINEAMWQRFWPDGGDPIGERLLLAPPSAPPPFSDAREIVGVVGGVRYGLGADVRPRLYTPSSQLPFAAASRYLVVATHSSDPSAIVPTLRELVREIDPDQPIGVARTLEDWRATSVGRERFQTLLLGLFGAVALALGALGVYGVVSYSVNQRRREAGIRMALGAAAPEVLRWVLAGAMAPVLLGVGFGLAVALALAGVIDGMLFGVGASDPATFLVIPSFLTMIAVGASLGPALRATRTDPASSLRTD